MVLASSYFCYVEFCSSALRSRCFCFVSIQGTTWLQEITWQIFNDGNTSTKPIGHRVLFFDEAKFPAVLPRNPTSRLNQTHALWRPISHFIQFLKEPATLQDANTSTLLGTPKTWLCHIIISTTRWGLLLDIQGHLSSSLKCLWKEKVRHEHSHFFF